MKTKLLALLSLTALIAQPVFADNTAQTTVDVSGDLLTSLEVSSTAAVMPSLVKPNAGETASVAMTCDGSTANNTTVAYSRATITRLLPVSRLIPMPQALLMPQQM